MMELDLIRILANPCIKRELGDSIEVTSAQLGGSCVASGTAVELLRDCSTSEMALIRRAIWEEARLGGRPTVSSTFLQRAKERSVPPFQRRATDVLETVLRHTERLGRGVNLNSQSGGSSPIASELTTVICAETNTLNSIDPASTELPFFLQYLEGKGELFQSGSLLWIKPAGVLAMEELQRANSQLTKAFVAMWFHPSMSEAWEQGIEPAIRAAGYDPFRIDKHHHENRIDDEIIAQIRKSRLLVADFTCGAADGGQHLPRGGVYFEAGFAAGLGIPVVWSVREDVLSSLHFDTRQFPHIVWKNPADLRTSLQTRIEALLGKGPGAD